MLLQPLLQFFFLLFGIIMGLSRILPPDDLARRKDPTRK